MPGKTPISAANDELPKITDKTIKKGTNTELSKFENNTEKLLNRLTILCWLVIFSKKVW